MILTKRQRTKIKKDIIKSLTDEENGIFDRKEGWACYNGTDLDMVMDCVIYALSKNTIMAGKNG